MRISSKASGEFSARAEKSLPLVDYGGVTAFLRGRSATATAEVVAAETGLPEARVQKWLDGANGMHADSFAALFAAYGIAFLRAACPWVGDLGAALDADRRQAELEIKRAAIEREMREIRPW